MLSFVSTRAFTRKRVPLSVRTVVGYSVLLVVVGCTSMPESSLIGEQAAYHVFNDTAGGEIFAPRLLNGELPGTLYANLQSSAAGTSLSRTGSWVRAAQGSAQAADTRTFSLYDSFGSPLAGRYLPQTLFHQDPSDETMMLPRSQAGAFNRAPPAHRIPRTVVLQWREQATPTQGRYSGKLAGPVRLVLRSSIPPAILARLSSSWRHRLEIAVGASVRESRVFWRLTRVTDQGVQTLEQGNFTAVRLSGDSAGEYPARARLTR